MSSQLLVKRQKSPRSRARLKRKKLLLLLKPRHPWSNRTKSIRTTRKSKLKALAKRRLRCRHHHQTKQPRRCRMSKNSVKRRLRKKMKKISMLTRRSQTSTETRMTWTARMAMTLSLAAIRLWCTRGTHLTQSSTRSCKR